MSSVGHSFSPVDDFATEQHAASKPGPKLLASADAQGQLLARREASERARTRARESAMLSSGALRFLDLLALSVVLVLVLLQTYLHANSETAGIFTMSVSMRNLALTAALLFCWRTLFWMAGLYQAHLTPSLGVALWRVPASTLACTLLVWPVITMRRAPQDTLRSTLAFWLISTAFLLGSRLLLLIYGEWLKPLMRQPRNVIICGTGARARLMALDLPHNQDYRYSLEGFVDSSPQPECKRLAPVLGGVDDLEGILMRQSVDEVLIALPVKSQFDQIQKVIRTCARAGVQAQYSLDLFTTEMIKHREVTEGERVTMQAVSPDSRVYLKNGIDFLVALAGLVVLSPLMLLIALLIKLDSSGPVFCVQERFGYNKRRFGMIKFRTMSTDAGAPQAEIETLNEEHGPLLKRKLDRCETRFGAFLRRSSLDELPQLFNVLRGDMSLVGPRPLPTRDVQRFSEAWLMRRFSVKPGITGLWQVSDRTGTNFAHAIRLDLRYIDRWSLAMDMKIVLRTFSAVLRTRGAY